MIEIYFLWQTDSCY